MACYLCLCYFLLLLLPCTSAVSVQPSNGTLPPQASQLQLTYTSPDGMNVTAIVAPLTSDIGLGQSVTALNSINIQGLLKSADAHSQDSLTSANIAYISCDPNTNTSNISPTDVINQLIAKVPNVKAILLYSFTAPHCSLTGAFNYTSILSMTSIEDSQTLDSIIDTPTSQPSATIMDQVSATTTSTPLASASASGGASNTSTPAPTTAVAMSILYSITGIITLLFLVIIATGAIRAHRHPERYGPRGGLPGRPRQSRAKGLARAMLETLPIVKFGDGDTKPDNREIELEEGGSEHQRDDAATPVANAEGEAQPETTEAAAVHAGIGPDENNHTHGKGPRPENTEVNEHLGCSICTEDFEKGEDVRVLPCNHKFHPACIDPWLLNVSGTCPLCRIDLRPAETNPAEPEPEADGDAALPPPLTEAEGVDTHAHPARSRLSRRLDAALMRNASAHERIAALRQLRQQQLEAGATAAGPEAEREEQSRRARLTGRLRDAFRIRTRPMPEPAAADVPIPAPEIITESNRRRGLEETL